MSGYVQMRFGGAGGLMPHVKYGRLRVLAVTSLRPSPLIPGLPAVAETVPGYEAIATIGVWTVAKTPDAIINRLNQEIVRIVRQPTTKEKLVSAGQDIVGSTPQELAATVTSETSRMGKVVRDAGIRAN